MLIVIFEQERLERKNEASAYPSPPPPATPQSTGERRLGQGGDKGALQFKPKDYLELQLYPEVQQEPDCQSTGPPVPRGGRQMCLEAQGQGAQLVGVTRPSF